MGRPSLGFSVALHTYAEERQLVRLRRLAAELGCTVSVLMREAVDAVLAAREAP